MSTSPPPPSSGSRSNHATGVLARRASIVAAGTLFSRLLGLVREQVLAAWFSRVATDIFFVAFLIPNVLRQLLAEGATQNGVLPVLTALKETEGEERARQFYARLRGLWLLLLSAVSGLGILFAPALVHLFAAGFSETPDKFERTVYLTRWVFPYIFFMGNAALGIAALNTHRRFVITSFAPALLNVAFIAAAALVPYGFMQSGQDPLLALAFGVLVGGVLQMVAQWPSLHAIGYFARPQLNLSDPDLRDVLRRLGPVVFGFGIYYLDVLVARRLLSHLGDGAPSYFTFAQRLCDFPQGIFVMAVQSASLPTLASLSAKKDFDRIKETLLAGVRLSLFAAIPATALLVGLAEPIVQLVFQRGHFDHTATVETAQAMVAQGCGVWMVACVRQLVVTFYALGDTRSPAIISGIDFLAFVVMAFLLQSSLGHVGVSWAVTGASAAQMVLLMLSLRRKLGSVGWARLGGSVVRCALASAGAVLVARAVVVAAPRVLPQGVPGSLFGFTGCVCFGAVFLVLARLLRSPELLQFEMAVKRRLGRNKP